MAIIHEIDQPDE